MSRWIFVHEKKIRLNINVCLILLRECRWLNVKNFSSFKEVDVASVWVAQRRTILKALSSAPPNRVQILIFRPSFKVRDCYESGVSTASRKFFRLHNRLQLSQNCKSPKFSTGSPRVKVFVVTVRAGTPRGWVRILRTLIKLNSWCRV